MTSTTLPERVIDTEPATIQVLKNLFKELEEIIEATEAGPNNTETSPTAKCRL